MFGAAHVLVQSEGTFWPGTGSRGVRHRCTMQMLHIRRAVVKTPFTQLYGPRTVMENLHGTSMRTLAMADVALHSAEPGEKAPRHALRILLAATSDRGS